jgi:hypothetical protein
MLRGELAGADEMLGGADEEASCWEMRRAWLGSFSTAAMRGGKPLGLPELEHQECPNFTSGRTG